MRTSAARRARATGRSDAFGMTSHTFFITNFAGMEPARFGDLYV